jgi:hypothetical protein
MVARLNGGHACAHICDNASALMAEDGRDRRVHMACHDVQVAVANAARRHLDAHLTSLWVLDINLANLEWFVDFKQYRSLGFHDLPSFVVAA